ncbi:phosphotransferase [Oleiagrimonas soli]|uniref:Phosphotransferase n=1 Tax=Oleiagrimonas soli TaxID=1543381 RepID=A0A099CSG4_9GAMM|nr:phosphotransferase [Oleiagrimonas soli]KGI76729.1 phosphotransferase [Oleiagrimonas soli]MBB6185038.1 putative hotdog family 3-hydroxylacyl-ACP dehydratase [Oleiagrimonas soli]
MLPKSDWAHLIPHAGGMCLLDAVVDWDDTHIYAVSEGHRDAAHPLRRDGRLHAVHLAEYGAQAAAVHGALRARAAGAGAPRPGVLVALRDVRFERDYIDDLSGALDVHAECLYADDSGTQYAFRIEHDGTLLAQGRCAVIHGDG